MKSQIQIFFRKSKATLIEPLKDFLFFFFCCFSFFFFDWIKTTTCKRYLYTMNMFLLLRLKLFEKRFCVMSIIDYFCIFLGGRLLGKPRLTCASPGKILGRMEKRIFSHDGGSTDRQNFPRARTSEKPCKGRLNKTYVTSELLAGSS